MPALFLDRDGVINVRTPNAYITTAAEFVFAPQALAAIALLSRICYPIVVVTNQAGIGRGLMTESDLEQIHARMLAEIDAAGGRIDAVFIVRTGKIPDVAAAKPSTGMGELARLNFPDFNWTDAWMVGDSTSDILFGIALGLKTALITGKSEEADEHAALAVDIRCATLFDFAEYINEMYGAIEIA